MNPVSFAYLEDRRDLSSKKKEGECWNLGAEEGSQMTIIETTSCSRDICGRVKRFSGKWPSGMEFSTEMLKTPTKVK